jgi:2-keto-4-pentenoate hydratase/2-oxohepta-3-ene-1,7-dioic acid hydratase in catechol pathway
VYLAQLELDGKPAIGLAHEGRIYDLTGMLGALAAVRGRSPIEPPGSLLDAAIRPGLGEAVAEAASVLAAEGRLAALAAPENARLRAPLPRPNRILAIGRNYAEHARESGAEVFEEPIVFLKASTSVIGPGEAIEVPEWVGRVDYEGELLVVLGGGGKNVAEGDALRLVAGYTLFNDVTARALQRADQERKHPWFRSKSMDTFGPMGPYLVNADAVPDPHDLRLTLAVNGETKQDDTTASMIHRIPALIAFLSRFFALEPGDVIATGTPSGIGPLVPGDTVEVTVEGLGTLRNPVIAAP